MNAMKIAAMIVGTGLLPGAALAQDALSLGDVNVMQMPKPAQYQPDSTDYDLADRGKTFDIVCTVGGDGKVSDCAAGPNNLYDQNFVKIGVGTRARDGSSTAGRKLNLTCKFNRMGGDEPVAAADVPPPHDRGRTDLASNGAPN
jgi:hypothetical protein